MDSSSLPSARARCAPGSKGSGRRVTRPKTRPGHQSSSSSDEEDFHSDDNLRPYEEVKIAHHDKKLAGLGLTPDEHAVSPLLPPTPITSGAGSASGGGPSASTSVAQNRAPRVYSYASDDETEPMVTPRSAVPLLGQGRPLPDHVVYDPPWDHIQLDHSRPQQRALPHHVTASESDEDNRQQRYSQTGTLPLGATVVPLPPPTFPPPPPPPIEDIPQRSPAPLRQYSFGPSLRGGNYSGADFRRPGAMEGEGEVGGHLENPYMVQNNPGSAFSEGRYPRTVPRSESVPGSSRGQPLEHLASLQATGYPSDPYPYHCPNTPSHPVLTHTASADRAGSHYPQFGVSRVPPGSYPPSNDYTDYSKFSGGGGSHCMKKQLSQRCTWKCTALLLLIMCVALLACTVYFAAMSMFEEGKVAKVDLQDSEADPNGVSDSSLPSSFRPGSNMGGVPATTPIPLELQAGQLAEAVVPPQGFWLNHFEQQESGFVKFDFTIGGSAILGIYGRQSTAPTHVQFDFFNVLDGSRLGSRARTRRSLTDLSHYSSKDTSMMEFLRAGVWFFGVYNDGEEPQTVSYLLNHHAVQSECPSNCSGRGDCVKGQCQCWEGFHGQYCALDQCPEVCNGQGELMDGRCRCYKGFKGSDCSLREHMCVVPNCNGNGHCINGQCVCFQGFQGPDCGIEVCRLECVHGQCRSQRCVCDPGWTGALCDQVQCDHRCHTHGFCSNGSCVCDKGWNGKHCTIDGCPRECSGHGECKRSGSGNRWQCRCVNGWKGEACDRARETLCSDDSDNDHDGLQDCYDPDCCQTIACHKSVFCRTAPEPYDILLSKEAPSPTASFFERMRFLIEENSVQMDATRNSFNESQVSVIRGRVKTLDGTPLAGVRVGVVTQPMYGFTLSREQGEFDILVNGGGSVKLELIRDPFRSVTASVLVPWNQIITMDTVYMALDQTTPPITPNDCVAEHSHHHLLPVVLSTWQHSQLGACPEHSTIIPESQVLQESIPLPGTKVNLLYHSSEASGYMSLVRIQMTPDKVPRALRLVHLRVAVEGVVLEHVFEADPNLKYTFVWNRLNAYNQKVYGIVAARVYVGYQYQDCDYIFWETRSTTVNGFDLTASHIGGWNLDIHHMYNYQEGILHKGDGTKIYLKEKPKTLINILGNGERRKLNCDSCDGPAEGNRLLAPLALASGLDGSLYLGDYNFIRKLSPDREEIASILEMSTKPHHKFHMTVSPVDGRLYISDSMLHKIIRVKTMGPVRSLKDNFEDVAGNGEECTPGEEDLCGDGGPAIQAKLRYPKGIAISKDGVIYVADGPNIRRITPDGIISTLIGTQKQPKDWTPMLCDDILSAERVSLKWPTALAINPLDDTLHILDHSIVLKLTADFKLVTVAGRPFYCPLRHTGFLPQGVLADDEQASSIAAHVTLVSPESITFGPHGDLYIVESDTHHINRIRVVTTDGHIHHFAGAKSRCDCQQTDRCKCFDPREVLAAQALFSDPTSITVTPDGVLHLADMGNQRVFSIVSQLPTLQGRTYTVVSPETQEMYVFNLYGQHKHTIHLLTNQYMYNFTYHVFSSYGQLVSVEDSAGNRIQIKRDYQMLARTILTPNNATCHLIMDNRRRLYQFHGPHNHTTTFTYMAHTELLESKHSSNGQTFRYEYDAMGRLKRISQPTGAVTVLETDVNSTGSIVHVSTDKTDVVAMATYGSVQSIMHGVTQTKVSYLPDGAMVVVFPSNLTVAIETGGHPVMDNEHRMHYKRKVIVPDHFLHRLEWRFYVRRKRRSGQGRVVEKIGQHFRVGALSALHGWHDETAIKEKALLINGENLMTIEYDRRNHIETVLAPNLREIITVVYNDAGLPTHFLPTATHHGMNVTYSPQGDLLSWQYGELMEQRQYLDHGRIKERVLNPAGVQYRYFYRHGSKKPTDVLLPSGEQYLFHRDSKGRLQFVETMVLGHHHFRTLLTIGRQRHLYTAPGISQPFISDYDTNGKLLQVLFPSLQRRVVYRYNHHFQVSQVLFDQTQLVQEYHPQAQRLSLTELISPDYEYRQTFSYIASLVRSTVITFPHNQRLLGATLTYSYDNSFRMTASTLVLSNNLTLTYHQTFHEQTGQLIQLKNLNITWPSLDNQTFSDGSVRITRNFDGYGRLTDVNVHFDNSVRYLLQINYDHMGRIHQWRRKVGQTDSQAVEYIYDIDSHLTDVLVEGQTVWTYAYDPNGNIKKITENGRTRHMEFDVGDKITMFGELLYKYDDDGLTAQRGLDHVAFNSLGQLTTVSRAGGGAKVTFYYNVQGRLVAQKDQDGRFMQFFYGDPHNPAHVTHTYNHTTGEASLFLYDTQGTLIAMQRSGKTYYIATDPNHTPLVIFDDRGYAVKQCSYTPLGLRILDSAPDFDLPFGFQGALYNDFVHLAFIKNRVYDTQLGRFLAPDYAGAFDKLKVVVEDPEVLNLYQHRTLVNRHLKQLQTPRLDLESWLSALGYNIQGMAPDVSYTGDLNPFTTTTTTTTTATTTAHELLTSSSAFECTFRRDMRNLLTMTSVPRSKVTPLHHLPVEAPSPLEPIFGDGVTVSNIKGRARVNLADIATEWARNLATMLLNNSFLVDLSFTVKGKDMHYFVRQDGAKADRDLRSLGIHSSLVTYENGVNVSVHRGQNGRGGEVDVRVHSNHTVINVRYGTSLQQERKRVLHHAFERAVKLAWLREKHLLQHSLPSQHAWSIPEMRELAQSGQVAGYVGQYILTPDHYPELADDCNNIRFIKQAR